jgi:hypothetical protein
MCGPILCAYRYVHTGTFVMCLVRGWDPSSDLRSQARLKPIAARRKLRQAASTLWGCTTTVLLNQTTMNMSILLIPNLSGTILCLAHGDESRHSWVNCYHTNHPRRDNSFVRLNCVNQRVQLLHNYFFFFAEIDVIGKFAFPSQATVPRNGHGEKLRFTAMRYQ